MLNALVATAALYLADYPGVGMPVIRFAETPGDWGYTRCGRVCYVTLNEEFSDIPAARLTLLHELGHVVDHHQNGGFFSRQPHGRNWRRIVRAWGLSGRTGHPQPPF